MTRLAPFYAALRQSIAAVAAMCIALAGFGAPSVARAADAGDYPSRPVHIVVPFGAGTQMDIAARLIGGKLADTLGQAIVVENYPGASGNIGSEVVAKAPADGYTLLFTGSLITLLPSTMGSRAVDPVAAFAPIGKVGEPPIVILVHPSLNIGTLADLIALARRQPGKIAYATAGIGTVQHLVASIISRQAGIEMIHVPYANTGQALKDVLSGEVPVYFAFLGPTDTYLRSGKLRALAVASNRRMHAWPDIPTVTELGYKEAAADPWNGVLAPAETPPQIVDLLYRELTRIVQLPDVRERFAQMGMDPVTTSPEQFRAEIKAAVARWPAVAEAAGVRADK
ncbi:MAG: Bug family tripartite tricarboxylate transporter substrate binding protein [Casimicrobiaceae bacterium]